MANTDITHNAPLRQARCLRALTIAAVAGFACAITQAHAAQVWWSFDYRGGMSPATAEAIGKTDEEKLALIRGRLVCIPSASVVPKENGTPASYYEARVHDPVDGRPLHPELVDKGDEVDVMADSVPLGGGPATSRWTERFFRTREACAKGLAEELAAEAAEKQAAEQKTRALDKYR